MQLLRDEPLYTLALADLAPRGGALTLRPGREYDLPMLAIWRARYNHETLGQDGPDQEDRALHEVRRHVTLGHLRILEDAGTPVAMTNFNAALPDMVQIGGVYTPAEFRGRGYAREAVARHLLEVRDRGVAHAVLFASGPAASKAYESIGFAHVGCYTLAILTEPREVQT
jgi:predicted GNAT family acetyltransferase